MGDPNLSPCPLALSISDALGKEVARHEATVSPASATALDVAIGDPHVRPQLRASGQRDAARVVKGSCETFLFSVEIYDLSTGITTLIMDDPEI